MQVNYELLGLPVLVTHDQMRHLTESENKKARFVTHLHGAWLAVDNRKGQAEITGFESFNAALAYLNEKNDC